MIAGTTHKAHELSTQLWGLGDAEALTVEKRATLVGLMRELVNWSYRKGSVNNSGDTLAGAGTKGLRIIYRTDLNLPRTSS